MATRKFLANLFPNLGSIWDPIILLKLKFFAESIVEKGKS